ncbi:MAG: primosomal protein N' [Azospirillaceae bacterium]|nr:primosomal protein N' [Azospirillaceae bacterium]
MPQPLASSAPDLLSAIAPPPPATVPPSPRVRVLLPLPLAEPYDYRVPEGLVLEPGAYVEVPLGPRRCAGVVWGDAAGQVEEHRLRPVTRRYPVPPMPEVQRRFIDWVANYTMAPVGAVLRMAFGSLPALDLPRPVTAFCRAAADLPAGMTLTAARRRILGLFEPGAAADGAARTLPDLARTAGCSPSVVRGLIDAGVLAPVVVHPVHRPPQPDPHCAGPLLSPAQAESATALRAMVTAADYQVVLLDGVTGSGKTEVYFEAIATALAAGTQVLVLLPEIALSSQWFVRFQERFGAPPVVWHSELTPAERRDAWRQVAEGTARVVVGARSALFLPFARLGLIVVDEEHEAAYKQADGVLYHARDMAVTRAFLGRIPIILASATPSLETLANVESGRYRRLELPARHGGATLPRIDLIDLRRDTPEARRWLAPGLRAALAQTLALGEQAMLFLNRRGYAPLTLCRRCGFRLKCPNCTAWLVEHRQARRLQCHHCGYSAPVPERCPACEAEAAMAACGPGVERIAEEAASLFPKARLALMTSDTLAGRHAIEDLVQRIARHEVDLLIGTQVMAKGHHFPLLTLVGVVDADLGLAGGDLRAGERTYQLLHQVAGRAGRAERPGRVLLQTWQPENPVMVALAAGDRDGFLASEAEQRRDHGMPPFGRLVALILSGEDEAAVERAAQQMARVAPRRDDVMILGPAPAPLAVLRGRHRRRLLLKAPRGVAVQGLITAWLSVVSLPPAVRLQIDIDPYGFL